MSDYQAGVRVDGCGCFSWLKSTVFPKICRKHGPTTPVTSRVTESASNSIALAVVNDTDTPQHSSAANSIALAVVNDTPQHSSSPWEDWQIEGEDAFLKKWNAWNEKCMKTNQPDLETRNVLEKIWQTLQGMLDEARKRGQQLLQSDLLKAALDAIPNNVAGYPAGGLVKVLVQLILLGLVSLSLSANCHMSHYTQKLAGAKQQVYDFTIEVVTDMNRIAGAFGKGTTDEKALRQCWEDLEQTR